MSTDTYLKWTFKSFQFRNFVNVLKANDFQIVVVACFWSELPSSFQNNKNFEIERSAVDVWNHDQCLRFHQFVFFWAKFEQIVISYLFQWNQKKIYSTFCKQYSNFSKTA